MNCLFGRSFYVATRNPPGRTAQIAARHDNKLYNPGRTESGSDLDHDSTEDGYLSPVIAPRRRKAPRSKYLEHIGQVNLSVHPAHAPVSSA